MSKKLKHFDWRGISIFSYLLLNWMYEHIAGASSWVHSTADVPFLIGPPLLVGPLSGEAVQVRGPAVDERADKPT